MNQLRAFDWSTFPCRTVPTGSKNGYAKGKNRQYAHREAFEAEYGPLPPGITVDHLCNTRNCVEPFHLEAVSRGENARRAWQRGARGGLIDINAPCRTRGHPPNYVQYGKKRGQWSCLTCRYEAQARRNAKLQA